MKVSLWKTLAGGLPTTTALYELRFDFHVRASTMDYAALATVAFPVQNNLLTYGLSWYGDHFDTSSPPGPGDPDRLTEGPGLWHTGTLRLERGDAGTYTLDVALDGVRIDEKTNLSLGTATTAQVRIGAYFTSVTPSSIDVVFDNVVATRK